MTLTWTLAIIALIIILIIIIGYPQVFLIIGDILSIFFD